MRSPCKDSHQDRFEEQQRRPWSPRRPRDEGISYYAELGTRPPGALDARIANLVGAVSPGRIMIDEIEEDLDMITT
jgi:hypothetical protein